MNVCGLIGWGGRTYLEIRKRTIIHRLGGSDRLSIRGIKIRLVEGQLSTNGWKLNVYSYMSPQLMLSFITRCLIDSPCSQFSLKGSSPIPGSRESSSLAFDKTRLGEVGI